MILYSSHCKWHPCLEGRPRPPMPRPAMPVEWHVCDIGIHCLHQIWRRWTLCSCQRNLHINTCRRSVPRPRQRVTAFSAASVANSVTNFSAARVANFSGDSSASSSANSEWPPSAPLALPTVTPTPAQLESPTSVAAAAPAPAPTESGHLQRR